VRAWGGLIIRGGKREEGKQSNTRWGEHADQQSPAREATLPLCPSVAIKAPHTQRPSALYTHTPYETPPDNQAWWSAGRAASEKGLGHLLQASIHEHGAVRM